MQTLVYYYCTFFCIARAEQQQSRQQRQSATPYLIREKKDLFHMLGIDTETARVCALLWHPFRFPRVWLFLPFFFLSSANHSCLECNPTRGWCHTATGRPEQEISQVAQQSRAAKDEDFLKAAMHCLLCHANQQKVVPLITLQNEKSDCTALCIPKEK